nr:hypothetical protein [Novosphingobium sp. KA1]
MTTRKLCCASHSVSDPPGERPVVGIDIDLPEDLVPLELDRAEVALAMRIVPRLDRRFVDKTAQRCLTQHQAGLACAGVFGVASTNVGQRPREHSARSGQ